MSDISATPSVFLSSGRSLGLSDVGLIGLTALSGLERQCLFGEFWSELRTGWYGLDSGESIEVRGERVSSLEDLPASCFSRVPRSVLPPSFSDKSPDSRRRDSMRPNRFSRPSIYLALEAPSILIRLLVQSDRLPLPFRGITFLLHMSEYALRLIVLTMCTGR